MVTHAATYLIRPMVSYRGLQLGIAPENLGLLGAAFSLGPLVVALRIGRLIDRRGEVAFVAGGAVLMAVASLGLALAPSVPTILVFFAALGFGHLMLVVATQALVARGSDASDYDRRFGHMSFAAAVGQLIGPGLAALVAGQGSPEETTRALFVAVGLSVLALPLIAGIRTPSDGRPARRHGVGSTPHPPLLDILRAPGIARAVLVSLTVLSAVDIVIIYLPALGEERGWSASLVGALLAARAASSMASRLFLGTLAARLGRPRLLGGSMAVAAVSLVLLPFAPTVPLTAAIMLAAGVGLGIGQPMTMSWIAAESPAETRATALSVRVMGNRLGQVVVPVVAGSVAAFAGAGGVLATTGLLVAASLAGVGGGLGSGVARSSDRDRRAA